MRLPLLIDVHCHTRGLNQEHKGTFATETMASLAGGIGTVLTMPNTDPPIVSRSDLLRASEEAEGQIYCDLGFHFGANGQNIEEFAGIQDLVKGLKVYLNPTTGNLEITDISQVARIFSAWDTGKPILVHAEGGDKLSRVIDLARRFKRRIHICHVSLEEEVKLIAKAKRAGVMVTAEACPHHCIFNEDDLPHLGSYGIMKPPLGRPSDVEAIWSGIKSHTIDIIATDHAPHSLEEKLSGNPPFGVIAEPAFSVMWMICSQRHVSIEHLAQLMYFQPARVFNIPTDRESEMEVDLDATFELTREMIHSKASRSPYEGMRLRGRIKKAFLHGQPVIKDGEILPEKKGQLI